MEVGIAVIGILISFSAIALFLVGWWFGSSTGRRSCDPLKDELMVARHECATAVANYATLTDNIAAAVIIRDREGHITYCSPFTEVLTGYARAEIYKAREDFFLTICHESEKERLFRSLQITALAGEPFHFTFQFYHKSGIRMWAETRTVPILDDLGEVESTLSVTLDVTAAVQHQRQVEEKNKELKDFTYMVSHDLKAPIFTVKGMATVLQEDFGAVLNAEGLEVLNHIQQATHRLEQLVSAVLEYSRIGQRDLAIVPVALDSVLGEVLADHHHLIEQTKAVIDIGELPTVLGDALSLSQVFSNLVGNALKYRGQGQAPHITIRSLRRALPHIVDIIVTDNGPGIPRAKLDDIFRPFVRLHTEEVEGTGIGLATVRKLLEKMGGQIRVDSEEGKGASFTATLREAD